MQEAEAWHSLLGGDRLRYKGMVAEQASMPASIKKRGARRLCRPSGSPLCAAALLRVDMSSRGDARARERNVLIRRFARAAR